MPLEIVPLELDHIDRIRLRESDAKNKYLLDYLIKRKGNFKAFAGIEDDQVLGIGGFVFENGEDEAEGFMALSDQAIEKPIRFTRIVRNKIREFLKEYPRIKRLRVYVDNRYVFERMNWILLLGFDEYRGPSPLSPGWATFVMQVKN